MGYDWAYRRPVLSGTRHLGTLVKQRRRCSLHDHNGTDNTSVVVNQQIAPADYVDSGGVHWYRLGVISPAGRQRSPSPSVTSDRRDDMVDAAEAILVGPVTTTAYDAAGQVTSTTDALGYVTTYAYDNLGRQTSTTLPDPDGGDGDLISPVTHTQYDADGS